MDNNKLWPLEQLLLWLHKCNTKKYCAIPRKAFPTLIGLLKFADNQTWECNPSFASLENVTMQSNKTIERHTELLEKAKIITIAKTLHMNNEYKIHMENLWISGAFCELLPSKRRYPTVKMTVPYRQNDGRTSSLTSYRTKKQSNYQKKDQELKSIVPDWCPPEPIKPASEVIKNECSKLVSKLKGNTNNY